MKKLLINGLLFCTITIVAYLLLFAVLFFIKPSGVPFVYRATQGNLSEGGGTWLKLHQFDKEKKWDVIVLGSSHAFKGYDPAVFSKYGLEMYNLGTSNQHMMCSYYIAKNALNKENCKLVILDIYDRVFSNEMIESMSDIIQNTPDDKTAIDIALSTPDIRAINMITLRFFNKTTVPLNYDTLGYVRGYQVAKQFVNASNADKKKVAFRYKSNERQIRYLDKMLAYLKQSEIPVVVTEHPLPNIYTVREHDKFLADIKPVLEKHGVRFLDYTNDQDFIHKLSYFSDENHLNHLGVPKYNERLIKDLVQLGVIAGKGIPHPVTKN